MNIHYMKISATTSVFIFCIIGILFRQVLPRWQLHFFQLSICLVPGPQMRLDMYKWTLKTDSDCLKFQIMFQLQTRGSVVAKWTIWCFTSLENCLKSILGYVMVRLIDTISMSLIWKDEYLFIDALKSQHITSETSLSLYWCDNQTTTQKQYENTKMALVTIGKT